MKFYSKKLMALFIAITLVFSVCGITVPTYAAEGKVFDVDKLIEAEKVTRGDDAFVVDSDLAMGNKYIVAKSNDGNLEDPGLLNKPTLSFEFNVPSDGKYAVYAKVSISSEGYDSFHSKIDNNSWTTFYPGTKDTWTWMRVSTESELEAGNHSFSWAYRELNAKYDSFFVTDDVNKLPVLTNTKLPTTTQAVESDVQEYGEQTLEQYKIENGSAIVEAENATVTKTTTIVNNGGASRRGAVKMAVADKNQPTVDAKAGLGFEVLSDKTAKYVIWARMSATDGSADSVWHSLNGKSYEQLILVSSSVDATDFKWKKIGTVSVKEGEVFTYRIIPRETGGQFDKFIVTSNLLYTPEGKGKRPPEMGAGYTITLPEGKYPKPEITPEAGEHPRVLFRKSDLGTIKANMETLENKEAKKQYELLRDTEFDGLLPITEGRTNYDAKGLAVIEAKAFDYVLTGNEENGKAAIKAIKNYAETCTYEGLNDATRNRGHIVFTAAEVYDWCYPLLTIKDKNEILSVCQVIGASMEVGFPPSQQGAVSGHGGEQQILRDWLALAIAVADEYPDHYDFIAGRVLSEYVDARNFWYKSQSHHQGSAYGDERYESELWSQWLIYRMSGETIYDENGSKINYQWIYHQRPDGQLMREGDDFNETGKKNTRLNTYAGTLFMASNFYKDPVLKKEFMRQAGVKSFNYAPWSRTPVQFLLINDPFVETEDIMTLPLTRYAPSPQGAMTARTGWSMGMDSPDVMAYMKIGEYNGSNHNHRDAGNFQIYYKGILASESGQYTNFDTHDKTYNKASIAHNTLLIASDTDSIGQQRFPANGNEPLNLEKWMADGEYCTGEVTGYEFGPDLQYPEYSYIAGDIAKAYESHVKEAVRSMIFMPTGNEEHPAVFVVFDRIQTENGGNDKKFLIHMQEEPKVEDNVSIITRTNDGYNGQLTNQTLLPVNANIEVIGGPGKEFMIGGTNYQTPSPNSGKTTLESGWGRIEISPKETGTVDYFLNVMYVGDADKNSEIQKAQLIETDKFAGTRIFDRVAIFNKNRERTKENIQFIVPGTGEVKVNVAGLEAGTWKVLSGEEVVGEYVSSDKGGIIYFTSPAGEINLEYISDVKNKKFDDSGKPKVEGVAIMLNENYLYSDVEPKLIDGRTLLPMRTIFEALNAEITWDEENATATAKARVKGETFVIRITENSKIAYVNDKPVTLDVPAMINNGRFFVPVRFVAEALKATVSWDEFGKLVKISAQITPVKTWDFPNVIEFATAQQSGDDGSGNVISNSYDGDLSTRWAAEGKNGLAWGIYDLGEVYSIDKIKLAYHQGTARVYSFDIAVSEDGENYTTVISNCQSSGTTTELEDYDMGGVKARYIKYIGGGNTVNQWNSVTEFVVIEKK